MKTILSSQTMDIPEGVKVLVKAKMIVVEGPRGKLTRNFKHLDFELIDGGGKLKADAWFGSRKTMAAIRTALSHVQNLITGVTKGYRYRKCHVKNKDIRKFLDGIYVSEMGTIAEEQ